MRVTIPIMDWSAANPAAIPASHPSQSRNCPAFRNLLVHGADVDQLVAPGFRDQPPRFFGRKPQLLAVDVIRRDVGGRGAEIQQFERKHRNPDRRRRDGGPGHHAPGKEHGRHEVRCDAAQDKPRVAKSSSYRPIGGGWRNGNFPRIDRVKYPILPCPLSSPAKFASKCDGNGRELATGN